MNLFKLINSTREKVSKPSPIPSNALRDDSYIHGAVPLRDILTGVFNGSPIPPDYLGEPHVDTDDTDVTEVDPYACFGYSRLDRESFVMDQAALKVDAEGNRARTARARTSNPTGDLGAKDPTPTAASSNSE